VKWASATGKSFLGEDRAHSGIAPSVEVKRAEVADAGDVDDLGAEDGQAPAKPTASPDATPKVQPEDLQLKKAVELLRDKRA
jgi:hypothetical protein